jgi:hypothetical protein
MKVLMLIGGIPSTPKNERGSLRPVSKVQQMELYLYNEMLMPEHAGDYLRGNPLPRYDASYTCSGNWYNQLEH